MIDHVLGRPSVRFRKYQVFAVVFVWSAYLLRGNRHGPPGMRGISNFLSNRLTTFQTVVISLLYLYIARNFGKLVGLECPEPLANLYSRSYFRATWITTALDAGFWSAMHIRRKWVRDLCSVVFSAWYLIAAEQADEKVRKIRSVLTVDHLRVAWNKTTTPYLAALARIQRPRFMRYPPRAIRIPRPEGSAYSDPVHGWLYFDGPLSALKKQTKIVLHIPGGGFVAMSPRTHDDALFAWAGKTGLPLLSLDYHKAPEFPYPYALNECYDVYTTLFNSSGRCVGLSGDQKPRVVVAGDSAGGNLAAGLVLMILQSGSTDTRRWHGETELPPPEGLVLVYPALDFNIGNWMTDEQMAVIRDRKSRKTNKRVLSRKRSDYQRRAPRTPIASDDEGDDDDDGDKSPPTPPRSHSKHKQKHDSNGHASRIETTTTLHKAPTNTPDPTPPIDSALPKTRLFTSSLISYVSDRVLTPEMMRAMIILYIGPHNRPDFSTDYLLSPVLAPDTLLARFPPTYFLTGERDPLVDDTVIMAGRIRQAKESRRKERQELGLLSTKRDRAVFDDDGGEAAVQVTLVEGVSHGFLQFAQVLPESWGYIDRVRGWLERCFDARDYALKRQARRQRHAVMMAQAQAQTRRMPATAGAANGTVEPRPRHHRRTGTQSSAISDDDQPLEMSSKLRLTKQATNGSASTPAVTPGAPDLEDDEDDDGEFASVPSTPGVGLTRSGKSLVSLASEDDLLGRRMRGLVGSLTRREDV